MRLRLLDLAWRNTLRNPRRTALTLFAFALGVTALVCAWSVFDGGNEQMINNMTGNYTGYVQIHRKGYIDDPTVDRAFGAADVAALRVRDIPGITATTPRMEALALISSKSNARALQLIGVDPQQEPQVTALHKKIAAGHYFQPGEKGGILIGQSLARMLEVHEGDELAVLTQGMQGSIGAQRYRVQGIYNTQNDMVDSLKVFISMTDAAELLSSEGQMTTIALRLEEREQADRVVRQLGAQLGEGFEVEGWKALLPEVAQSVDFHESVGKFITVILFGIVASGVANTVLMSVLERRREFGVMMAVGTSARQVFRIVIYEGLILGLLGFAIGLAVSYMLVSHFGASGIEFAKQGDAIQNMQGVSRVIHPHLGLGRMLYICAAVLFVILLASLYPAWKIARMLPLHAMQGHGSGGTDHVAAPAAPRRGVLSHLLPLLAVRNLKRHPMRSGITLFAITFGLGAFVFVGSIANGFYTQIVDNATGMVTGDAQVQLKGFKDDMKPTLALPNGRTLLDQVQQAPSVAGASPRVQTTAMVTSAVKSLPVLLIGVDPDAERQVTFLDKSVKEGRYLQAGHEKDIVIGRKLAELLHVRVGERVILMTQDVHGNLASERFIVSGLFQTGSHSFDDVMAHVNLPTLQKMVDMDDRITNVAMRMKARTPEGVSDMSQVAALMPPGDEVRLLTWQELVPQVAQMNALFKGALMILLTIVLLMVSVVVMNTVLMSVMERTREFGTMLALGSRPGLIVRLVQLEAVLIGVAGTVTGLAFGVLLTAMHGHGIDMKMHGASIPGVTNMIFPKLSPDVLIVPGVLLPLLTLMAALYPSWRAARLDAVKAMRHV